MRQGPIRRVATIVCCVLLLASCTTSDGNAAENVVDLKVSARAGGPPTIEVIEPIDGATVESPFVVRVDTENVALAASGRTVDGEGHWHLMVDGGCLAAGEVIPKDDEHLHVGSGANEAEFDLSPGVHDLCVQLGDGFHVAVSVTDVIRVNVVDSVG